MADLGYALPQVTSLKISNMTTFPKDIRIFFEKNGVHVIFGGNYSGKTTIVNSLNYGIFGLSSHNLPEGVEKRYFVSRIKENERKSLEIDAICNVNHKIITVNRKVFSSSNTVINGIIANETGFVDSPQKIVRENEYYDALKGSLGNVNQEELNFISKLLFADEKREPILWTKKLLDFTARLLSSPKSISEIRNAESNLEDTELKLSKSKQEIYKKEKDYSDKSSYLSFLKNNLKDFDTEKLLDFKKELEKTKVDLSVCRSNMLELNEKYEKEIVNKNSLLKQMHEKEKRRDEIINKRERLKTDYFGAFFKLAGSDVYSVGNYIYHNRQCPICLTDISKEVSTRLDDKKCPLCGKSDLENKGSMDDIEKLMSHFECEKENIVSLISAIEEKIVISQQELDNLSKLISEQHTLETSLLSKINGFKSLEEDLNKHNLLVKQLDLLTKSINDDEVQLRHLNQEMEAIGSEIEKLKQISSNLRANLILENAKIISQIRHVFSTFVDMSTNSEIKANLSRELIPEINGRAVFTSDAMSQFERTLLDYAFRIAVLNVFAERTASTPSLVLETPDEGVDEAYIPYLANAIFDFSKQMIIIITTCKTGLMRQILDHYGKNEKSRHVTELISKGTLTQRKCYGPSILDFSEPL